MPKYAQVFTKRIKTSIAPALLDKGFAFDGRRTFRRFPKGSRYVQIIDLQLGVRFMAGRFTVNLAVYDPESSDAEVEAAKAREYHCHPALRQRLGPLIPKSWHALEQVPVVGVFFGPRGIWWAVSNPHAFEVVRGAILAYGLPWLEAHVPDVPSKPKNSSPYPG